MTFVAEDPPFGGPVAGIAAALAVLPPGAAEVLLLAGDLADPAAVVDALAVRDTGRDGVVLEDEQGWAQYLAGRYRAASIVSAVADLGSARDVSVRRLMRALEVTRVPVEALVTRDLDSPGDAKREGIALPRMRDDGP